jgi:hypothetical protein
MSDTNPFPDWLRDEHPDVENDWREWFTRRYLNCIEGTPAADAADAWTRFRADVVPRLLVEHPARPGEPTCPREWVRATLAWVETDALENAWRKEFGECYADYMEGKATPADVAGAWTRFRAQCLPQLLAEHPPRRGGRAWPDQWFKPTFHWIGVQDALACGLAQGMLTSVPEPGPDGKLELRYFPTDKLKQQYLPTDVLGKPPGQPEGRPGDN